jgi:bifunctional UDP-N-acetylglucosamine pyrophosphorylase/glucosamine-1-phosphate N-acetyltransferase
MLKHLSCVILVGGVEHRFSGPIPRALQILSGIPVVEHIIKAVETLGIDQITVVSNALGLENYLGHRAVHIHRDGSKGSGDALFMAKSRIESYPGDVLVVYGDRPLMKATTLESLVNEGRKSGTDCAMLTVNMGDPHGHARIIRRQDGTVERTGRDCEIVTEEGKIREVIAGAYYFRKRPLLDSFKALRPEGAVQFYVTDITSWMAAKNQVTTLLVLDPQEVQGVYSAKDIAEMESVQQESYVPSRLARIS